jgi:hypothetical protein
MLRTRIYLAYERQFRNLNIKEMRLQRLREKLIAEIKQLQMDRVAAKHDRKPFDPTDHGFEFSTEDVEAYLQGQRVSILTEKAMTAPGR